MCVCRAGCVYRDAVMTCRRGAVAGCVCRGGCVCRDAVMTCRRSAVAACVCWGCVCRDTVMTCTRGFLASAHGSLTLLLVARPPALPWPCSRTQCGLVSYCIEIVLSCDAVLLLDCVTRSLSTVFQFRPAHDVILQTPMLIDHLMVNRDRDP